MKVEPSQRLRARDSKAKYPCGYLVLTCKSTHAVYTATAYEWAR